MRHIYYEKKEIPIPEGGHVNRHDGAVRIYLDPTVQRRKSATMVIGRATSATTMHPNDNFRQRYPALWEQYYGERTPVHVLHYGMYLTALSAGWRTGCYEALHDAFGPQYGNALMDWAMFTMLCRSNAASSFPDVMADQAVFSRQRYDDDAFSDDTEKYTHLRQLMLQEGITPLTAYAYLLFILLYFPCIATIAAIKNETGSWRWALFAAGYTTAVAWIISALVYQVGCMMA